jgi:hypothetical protein
LSCCDIDTLLNARLLSTSVRELIDRNITQLAENVAATTFPAQPWLTAAAKWRASQRDLAWLRDLKLRQVAAILAEQCLTPSGNAKEFEVLMHDDMFPAFAANCFDEEFSQCVYDGLSVWAEMFELAQRTRNEG